MFPPKPQWGVDQNPNLSGKVMIVTGGNAGIGKETVRVYMANRNAQRVQDAIEKPKGQTRKVALLADLHTKFRLSSLLMDKEDRLDVLFNSGGLMYPPVEQTTKDVYGTNVISHFYLTQQLLPLLIESAKTSSDEKARVINTSSMGHSFVSGIDFDTLRDGPKRIKAGTMKLYSQSKFANVVFSNELHRRYAGQGIVSVSLHPGTRRSRYKDLANYACSVIQKHLLYPAPMGALTQLYAGTTPEGANLGELTPVTNYLIPWARVGRAKKETGDVELARKLWDWLENAMRGV
ncbi:hypothetical protein BN946_scf185016.g31 [Trametes cinnabarina]|uniref:NAD(P)-binding protein n=1 Tax=Pycnoporus cinnabarinus TaxID=5643 RepID=A0A060SNT8_PYCCI|nr:hypothetical protein BN946_scf185016.g31 [Trametes cinnabarina]